MSDDIKRQITACIKASGHFALQIDKSTDLWNKAVFLIYLKHVWGEDLQEQFLCTSELLTTKTAEGIFSSMDLYLSSVGLNWDMCVCIATDGAASMTAKLSGVVRRVLDRAPNASWKGCFWHGEALAAKDMVPVLHETLKDVVRVVNYIKQSATITTHLNKLLELFNDYPPEKQRDDDWIRDLLGMEMGSARLPAKRVSWWSCHVSRNSRR